MIHSRKKVLALLAAVFVVTAVLLFLIWPAERYDQSACSDQSFCTTGDFTSVPGGGALYIKNVDDAGSAGSFIQQFNNGSNAVSYSFAPLLVGALSVVVALGIISIIWIVIRKLRRDRRLADQSDE